MELSRKLQCAIKEGEVESIISTLDNARNDTPTNISELFEILTALEKSAYWKLISKYSQNVLKDIYQSATEEKHKNFSLITDSVNIFLQTEDFRSEGLFDTINILSNLLTTSQPDNVSYTKLQLTIAKICEACWTRQECNAEKIIVQLITYYLVTALQFQSKESDVKRLYNVRTGLLLVDLDHESSSFVRNSVVRCFIHPNVLRSSDGQKFLSFALTLSGGNLIKPIIEAIKPQLLSGVKYIATTYGEILLKAWKDVSSKPNNTEHSYSPSVQGENPVRSDLEDAYQDLIKEAINTASGKYFSSLRLTVKAVHDVRRSKPLDAMLLRVFDPILWRSLRCANAKVRAQACVLFLDVFPLQHVVEGPSQNSQGSWGGVEEEDRKMQKQFDVLSALLRDDDHRVRAHAALGACHILNTYWEALPAATTHNILKFLVDTLAVDASSANVRLSVFLGLSVLLQQPLAHSVLAKLLPLLQNSIHDKSEKVRIAFVKVLCQVKGIRGMHFYEIVEIEHLMERLAVDISRPAVCIELTGLFLNSFHPSQGQQQEQLRRCLKFIDENETAACTFYGNLHHHVSVGSCAKLSTMLFTLLLAAAERFHRGVEEKPKSKRSREDKKSMESSLSEEEQLIESAADVGRISGLTRVLSSLLLSIEKKILNQPLSKELILKYLTIKKLRRILHLFLNAGERKLAHLASPLLSVFAHIVNISEEAEETVELEDLIVEFSNFTVGVDQGAVQRKTEKGVFAKAIVELVIAEGREAELLQCIRKSFNHKKVGNLSTGDSVILLQELLPLVWTNQQGLEQINDQLDNFFQMIRLKAAELFSSNPKHLDRELTHCLILWCTHCLHQDASNLLTSDLENSKIVQAVPYRVDEVVGWCLQLVHKGGSQGVWQAVGVVLLQLCDACYVSETLSASVTGGFNKVLEKILECENGQHDFECLKNLMVPVGRLVVIFTNINTQGKGETQEDKDRVELVSKIIKFLLLIVNTDSEEAEEADDNQAIVNQAKRSLQNLLTKKSTVRETAVAVTEKLSSSFEGGQGIGVQFLEGLTGVKGDL